MSSNPTLILASNSPRRIQLLKQCGYQFSYGAEHTDESFPSDMDVNKVAGFLAVKKNEHHRSIYSNSEVILTADTTVIADGKLLEKASDGEEAKEMLKSLSGRQHQVVTGVCISDGKHKVDFSSTTVVTFKELTEEEIDFYIENFKPYDKAGAYGVQEWIGMIGITNLNGSYYNVVGLPMDQIYGALKEDYGVIPHLRNLPH